MPEESRSRLARAAGLVVPTDNPARHVDGIITTGALLAAESTRHESIAQGAGAVTAVIVIVWLSHTYGATLAERLECGHRLSARQFYDTAAHEMALLRGAFIPLIVLVVADAAGSGIRAAVIAALVSAVVLLFTLELAAAVRHQLGPAELVAQVGLGVLIGGGLLLLKVIL
jgi:hypothetical protein